MTDNVTSLPDRFLDALSSGRVAKHKIDDTEYVQMMFRMLRGLEVRGIENPELLTQTIAIAQRANEITNVIIAANAERYHVDPLRGASMMECARVLGISKQSASDRRKLGKAIMLARIAAAGAVRFSEARRERETIQAAQDHAVINLTEWRGRHRAA